MQVSLLEDAIPDARAVRPYGLRAIFPSVNNTSTMLRQAQQPINEPLFLIHKNYCLKLSFNCKDCIMEVRKG